MSIHIEMRPRWSWRFFVFWRQVRQQPGLRIVNVGMQDVYRLSLGTSLQELILFAKLWSRFGQWPEIELWINGRKAAACDFNHIFGCLQQAIEAPSVLRYCQGEAPFIKANPRLKQASNSLEMLLTNCRFLVVDDPLAQQLDSKRWYEMGNIDGEGIFHVHKHDIQAYIQSHAQQQHCTLCPLFDMQAITEAIAQLPERIEPHKDPRWQYRFDHAHRPIGVMRTEAISSWAGRTDMDTSETSRDVDEAASIAATTPAPTLPEKMHTGHNAHDEWEIRQPRTQSTREIGYADVGGLRDAIRLIREVVEVPLRFPDLIQRMGIRAPKGILLHGPPGCGKTLLAEAVAHEVDAAFFPVKGPEFLSALHGQSEKRLRDLFAQAEKHAPSILFFDELDAFAFDRGRSSSSFEATLVAQFLALLDGFDRRAQICIIATTNRLDILDPALLRPGRFDHRIHIGLPNEQDRLHIFGLHTSKLPLHEDVDLAVLAHDAQGYTGADIAAVCAKAGLIALYRALGDDFESWIDSDAAVLEKVSLRKDDLAQALQQIKPSVNA